VSENFYEWTLPDIDAVQCLTLLESFDDGRYRQVSFEASTPDCKYTATRYKNLQDGGIDDTQTDEFSVSVWPVRAAPVDGTLLEIDLEATVEITVN